MSRKGLTPDQSVPLLGGEVESAVVVVWHQLDDVVEPHRLGDVLDQVDAKPLEEKLQNVFDVTVKLTGVMDKLQLT